MRRRQTRIAAMIACKQNMVLYSYNVSAQNLSSYTLISELPVSASRRAPAAGALEQQQACAESKKSDSDDVGVVPNADNFKRAQRIVIARAHSQAKQCISSARLRRISSA